MCQLGDIHANDTGYAVMAGTVAAHLRLGRGSGRRAVVARATVGSAHAHREVHDGDDPAYGLVDGTGEKIAEITGDPLYQRIELTGTVHEIDDVRLLAPVIPRSKVIGIGRNYADHARGMGGEAPHEPMMFLVPNTAVSAPATRS